MNKEGFVNGAKNFGEGVKGVAEAAVIYGIVLPAALTTVYVNDKIDNFKNRKNRKKEKLNKEFKEKWIIDLK